MTPGIFLDRDGVIIENRPDYVRSWADVSIYPQALEALRRIADLPHTIVIVTNQSAVGRGLISLAAMQAINDRLVAEIRSAGGRIDGVLTCPHAPEDGCDCRKPRPGLLMQAAEQFAVDLQQSFMVGDAVSDLQAAQAAGIPRMALVCTGRGREQAALAAAAGFSEMMVFEDLSGALTSFVLPTWRLNEKRDRTR